MLFTAKHVARKREVERFAVILAGGEGSRLRTLTRSITGDDRPKQFCPIIGGQTLLDHTRKRVALSVARDKTFTVVTESHERFYQPLAQTRSEQNRLLIQPTNKGTAPAILYALHRIAATSPNAVVAFFPSDHYFADENRLAAYVEAGFAAAERYSSVILFGIAPEGPEVEYGWIESYPSILGAMPGSVSRVRRFWEKPSLGLAHKLLDRGCLWNSFIMIGRVDAFLRMTKRALPKATVEFEKIYSSFGTWRERSHMREVYSRLGEINFSSEVLSLRPDDLSVLRVGGVGWSDLGEPSRVLQTLGRLGAQTELALSAS